MSTRGMAALVAGLGNGYFKATERRRREDIEDEERAYTMQERAFTKAERDRALKQREDLGAAAAPIAAEAVPQLDLGDPEAPPPTTRYRVAGKMLDTTAEADAAVKTANGAPAVAMRQAAVLQQSGDPVKAQALRTGSMQEQAGQLALSAAERADLKARFTAQLEPLTDFDQVGEFMSKSGGDGQGGNLKVQFVPSPDGKTVVLNTINPDGTLKPTARTFENSNKGLTLAKAQLGGLPPEKMLEHFHREAVEARAAAAQAAAQQHQAATLAEQSRHNKATEGHQSSMLAATRAKAAATAAPQGMTLADLKDGHKGIASTLNADWKTQIDSETDPAKLKSIKVAREAEIATVQRLYTGAMQAGFGLTPEQAIVAFRSGETAKQSFRSRDGSGTVTVEGVMYGGRFIPLADNPGAMPGAKPPGAAPDPALPSAKAAPAPAAPKAPPAEKAPAPAGSPQAAWDAKQAKARTDMTDAAAAKTAAATALSEQFQADKAALSPLELAQKYDKSRGKLSTKDAAELQAIERSIR